MKRICILSNKVPYPATDGSSIAMARLLEAFLALDALELTYAALNTAKHRKNLDQFPAEVLGKIHFEHFEVDTSPNLIGALYNALLTRQPYHSIRFWRKELVSWLERFEDQHFDLIVLEGAFMGHYLEIARDKAHKVVLRAHNLEFQIWERTSATMGNPLKKIYLQRQSARLKKFEQHLASECHAIWTVSPVDAQWFSNLNSHSTWIPVHIAPRESIDHLEPLCCFHLGAMDWLPNQRGVQWFLEEVWPLVRQRNPKAVFHLAGNAMPSVWKTKESEGIYVHGRVESAEAFAKSHGVAVIPLLSGSGVRIKILENASWGIPMVSTSVGCEGIYDHGNETLKIADQPEDFAHSLLELLQNSQAALALGSAGQHDIMHRFGLQKTVEKLAHSWSSLS